MLGRGSSRASLYIFTIGFAAFDVPAIIGWSNRLFTFSTYLLVLLSPELELPRYGAVAALSMIVVVLAGLMSWWYSAMQRRSHRYEVVTGKGYRPKLIKLGGYIVPAWGYLALYFVLSKGFPLLLLVWASLLPFFELPSAKTFAALSLENYRALPWDLALKGLKNTTVLMVLTPTITIAVSLAFSWIVLRSRIPGRSYFDLVAFLPHAVPNIVFSVGALLLVLYVLEAFVPVYGTIWLLLVVFVIGRVSYGTRMTNGGLIQIHRELEGIRQNGWSDHVGRDAGGLGAASDTSHAVRLVVDCAAHVPGADPRGAPNHVGQHHAAAGHLEPLDQWRARPSLRPCVCHAGNDGSHRHSLLDGGAQVRAACGLAGDVTVLSNHRARRRSDDPR